MSVIGRDITRNADVVRRALPLWPYPDPAPCSLTEVTIGWGEDARCTVCLCDLPAGAPAWTDRDGVLCCDDAAAEGAA
jgi:hypothetical protein